MKKLIIAMVIVILTILGIAVICYLNDHGKNISSGIQVAANFAIAVTLIVTVLTYLDKQRIEKHHKTFDLLDKYDSPDMRQARNLSREIKKDCKNISSNQLLEKINTTPKLEESIILLYNYFTKVRYAIEIGIVDKEVVMKELGETMIDIMERFIPWAESSDKSNGFIKDSKEMLKDFKKWTN